MFISETIILFQYRDNYFQKILSENMAPYRISERGGGGGGSKVADSPAGPISFGHILQTILHQKSHIGDFVRLPGLVVNETYIKHHLRALFV